MRKHIFYITNSKDCTELSTLAKNVSTDDRDQHQWAGFIFGPGFFQIPLDDFKNFNLNGLSEAYALSFTTIRHSLLPFQLKVVI